ncbi:MAG TPA: OmpA family protein [Steroidobacteraceae bacterium]|nr:OmpA family protein [Steroidobacteraceae bacterium]
MTHWRRAIAMTGLLFAQICGAADTSPVSTLAADLEQAKAQQVNVLSPKNFARAVEAFQSASRDAEKGKAMDKIRARVNEGEAALKRAQEAASAARQLVPSTISTRDDALKANAPRLAPEAWAKAAQRFNDAMLENEQSDIRNAQKKAAEAEVLLRDAELIAIKASVLDEARSAIAEDDAAKVGKIAPRSLDAAKRYLAQAEQEVQRNRYDLTTARNLAAQARYEAHHAAYLAKLISTANEAEKDDKAGFEAMILAWEEPLKRMAKNMELAVRFDQGFEPALQEIEEHVRQQQDEIRRLKADRDDRDQQIATLKAQLEKMDARLGGVSEERIALQRRVDAQERVRINAATIESSFTPDEARVLRQGDDVVISLLGIKFPPGKSTVDSSNAALMQKVRDALQLFPDASISVEGHTDANGSDSANLILSQDRADSVKSYLVSNFGMNPEKISSIGYGEARPVATNETPEGRARNRRIDLVIHVQLR